MQIEVRRRDVLWLVSRSATPEARRIVSVTRSRILAAARTDYRAQQALSDRKRAWGTKYREHKSGLEGPFLMRAML
jgi:hypothetical protein